MGKFLKALFFSLACASNAFAVQGLQIKAATNNIATTYSTTAAYVLTGIKPLSKHIYVYNSSAGTVALTLTSGSASIAPSAGNAVEMFVGANSTSGGTTFEFIGTGAQIFVRSANGAALTTGEVLIDVW